jgi:hypothetical protein
MPLGKLWPNRRGATRARGVITSALGQGPPWPAGGWHSWSTPSFGNSPCDPALTLRAKSRLMHRSKEGALFDHLVGAGVRAGSFGQPRFPKALNVQLRV